MLLEKADLFICQLMLIFNEPHTSNGWFIHPVNCWRHIEKGDFRSSSHCSKRQWILVTCLLLSFSPSQDVFKLIKHRPVPMDPLNDSAASWTNMFLPVWAKICPLFVFSWIYEWAWCSLCSLLPLLGLDACTADCLKFCTQHVWPPVFLPAAGRTTTKKALFFFFAAILSDESKSFCSLALCSPRGRGLI